MKLGKKGRRKARWGGRSFSVDQLAAVEALRVRLYEVLEVVPCSGEPGVSLPLVLRAQFLPVFVVHVKKGSAERRVAKLHKRAAQLRG